MLEDNINRAYEELPEDPEAQKVEINPHEINNGENEETLNQV